MTREEMTDWLANALLASGPVHQTLACFYLVGRMGGLAHELVLELNDGRQYRLSITGPLPAGEKVAFIEHPDDPEHCVQEVHVTEPEPVPCQHDFDDNDTCRNCGENIATHLVLKGAGLT